jgi:predicted transcriptional regulator
MPHAPALSKREQQIMDVIYARGQASAVEAWQGLSDPPSRTAIRTILGILESKGHLRHKKVGREFVYLPTNPRGKAGRRALRRVIDVFFSSSVAEALAAHLADRKDLTPEELAQLSRIIEQATSTGTRS